MAGEEDVRARLGIKRRAPGGEQKADAKEEAAEAKPAAAPAKSEPAAVAAADDADPLGGLTSVTDADEAATTTTAEPEEKKDDIRAGLGIKRRSAAPVEEKPEETAPAKKPADEKPAPKTDDERADDEKGAAGDEAAPAEAEAAPAEPAGYDPADPAYKPVGKRLPKDAQLILRRYYHHRLDVDLPPWVFELEGTWGRYYGDGRDEREIVIGWRPAFVVFTMPVYPDEQPQWIDGEFTKVGLHRQPEFTDRGFLAWKNVNKLGDMIIYVVWKSDGRELQEEPAAEESEAVDPNESPRDRARREAREKSQRELEERRSRARDARKR